MSNKKNPGTTVEIEKRSHAKNRLKIGILSFTGDRTAVTYFSSNEFLRALAIVSSKISKDTDVILCAARRVYWSKSPDELKAPAVLKLTHDAPILFESYAELKSGREVGEWKVAHRCGRSALISRLRKQQLVGSFNDRKSSFKHLAEALAVHAGVLSVSGSNLRLILLICGESNLLKTSNLKSAIRARRIPDETRELLSSPWVLLNPSHRAYWPMIARTGAGNVFSLNGRPPFLSRLVSERPLFRDGTTRPIAVVHANTFLSTSNGDRHATADVSHLVFSRDQQGDDPFVPPVRLWSSFNTTAHQIIASEYVEYLVPCG